MEPECEEIQRGEAKGDVFQRSSEQEEEELWEKRVVCIRKDENSLYLLVCNQSDFKSVIWIQDKRL